MLTLNAMPFSTGWATHRDFDPEDRLRKQGCSVQVAFPGSTGGSLYALLDTGTPYCVFNTAVVENLGLSFDEGEKITLRTAYGPFEGTVQRMSIRLLAEQGESLNIEASVFVTADWHLGNFLGYTGFLERFRFAVDPGTNTFYYGPCAP
jgi:predicted aspartyl protease